MFGLEFGGFPGEEGEGGAKIGWLWDMRVAGVSCDDCLKLRRWFLRGM